MNRESKLLKILKEYAFYDYKTYNALAKSEKEVVDIHLYKAAFHLRQQQNAIFTDQDELLKNVISAKEKNDAKEMIQNANILFDLIERHVLQLSEVFYYMSKHAEFRNECLNDKKIEDERLYYFINCNSSLKKLREIFHEFTSSELYVVSVFTAPDLRTQEQKEFIAALAICSVISFVKYLTSLFVEIKENKRLKKVYVKTTKCFDRAKYALSDIDLQSITKKRDTNLD